MCFKSISDFVNHCFWVACDRPTPPALSSRRSTRRLRRCDRTPDRVATARESRGARQAPTPRFEACASDLHPKAAAQAWPVCRPSTGGAGSSSEDAANGVAWVGELAFKPAIESHLEQRTRGVFRRDFEQRVDAGFDRAFAQQVRAERMNRSDASFFKLRQRAVQELLSLGSTRPAIGARVRSRRAIEASTRRRPRR